MESDKDHIHLLIECKPQHYIPNIVKANHGISSWFQCSHSGILGFGSFCIRMYVLVQLEEQTEKEEAAETVTQEETATSYKTVSIKKKRPVSRFF